MLMLIYVERIFIRAGKSLKDAPIAWALGGRAVVIRDKDQLVKNWIPLFFPPAQFKSFSRKLYRWQFRQVNPPSRDDSQKLRGELVFSNSFFQRDQRELMVYMQSITAAGVRRQKERAQTGSGMATPKSVRTIPGSGTGAVARQPQGELELPAVSQPAAPLALSSMQLNPWVGQYAPMQVHGSPFGLPVQQLQQASMALMQLDPRVQQQLILASYMNNLRAQPSIPALLPSPVFPLNLLGAQPQLQAAMASDEQKQPDMSNLDEQERIRRAAEILLRGANPPRPPGPSSGPEDQGRQGPPS